MVTMGEEDPERENQKPRKTSSSSPFSKSPSKKPANARIPKNKEATPRKEDSVDFFKDKPKKEPVDKEHLKELEKEQKKQAELKKIRAREDKERKKQYKEEEKRLAKQEKNGIKAKTGNYEVNSPNTKDERTRVLTPPKITQASPKTPQVRSVSYIACKIELLDGTVFDTSIDRRTDAGNLLDKVCEHITLEEKDYFGLYYIHNQNKTVWLDNVRPIYKQLHSATLKELDLVLAIKFYPPYPTQLQEDFTRYQLCLQVRRDIQAGLLPCAELTYSLLGSYTAQSELGDHDLEEHGAGSHYLKRLPFLKDKSDELYDKVSELHMAHKGMTPEQAEYHFLENARKLEFYGVTFHKAYDGEGVSIELGVSARGLTVYRDSQRLSRFVWPQITKLSYRQNTQIFYVSLRPVEFETYKRVVGFQMLNNEEAKALWAECSEHHTFFRLKEPNAVANYGMLSFGSKFRYSGRTQHQMRRSLSMSSMSRAGSITRLSSARSVDGRL